MLCELLLQPILTMEGKKADRDIPELLQDERYCHFYLKTGACKYGHCCQRTHLEVSSSRTLVAYSMFTDPALEPLLSASTPSLNPCMKVTSRRTIPDDEDLEEDLQVQADIKGSYRRAREESERNYRRFYQDVYPEFEKFGEVAMFKCCNNLSPHLRGNVYIEFKRESDCQSCYKRMNGRYYAGQPLSLSFIPLTDWKTAICAYNAKGKCPKLLDCNFLHVYENPNRTFPVDQRTRKRSRSRG